MVVLQFCFDSCELLFAELLGGGGNVTLVISSVFLAGGYQIFSLHIEYVL